ncbi:MAG: DUF1566 domain-containing protein, partial [Candidatus Saccharimonadales bacterium]
NVTSDGGDTVTQRGIVYSTSQNPTTANSKVTSGSGTGSFTANMTGLAQSTTYYVRAYAINGAGTSYGNQVSFTTTSRPACNIGSTGPGGGIIFYNDGGNTCYEAAPSGWDGGSDPTGTWCNGYQGAAIESGDQTTNNGLGNQAIGQGASNTATMLANANCNNSSDAEHLAANYNGGGKTDWFLPSLYELNQLYNEKSVVGGFASDSYWSSSEYSSSYAWNEYFTSGPQSNGGKGGYFYVRPVRAF